MFGIAVIFILMLWIGLIILSVWLPFKIFKGNGTLATILAVIGFMLTCGFWVIKWNTESITAQKEAEEMCKQAGVTIYVQPEKWKEMVGGEEAWKELGYQAKSWNNLTNKDKENLNKNIDFEGLNYVFSFQYNKRIASYEAELPINNKYGKLYNVIYYDTLGHSVLYKEISYYPTSVDLTDGFKVLFFRKGKNCPKNSSYDPFSDLIYRENN